MAREVNRLSRQEARREIPGLDDAHHVVETILTDRKTGMAAFGNLAPKLARRIVHIQPVISVRGVMITPTCRSARRSTPVIISCSAS